MLTCIKKTLNSANGNIYETHVHDMCTIYKYFLKKKHFSKTYAEICWKDVLQTNANSITVCKPLLESCFFFEMFCCHILFAIEMTGSVGGFANAPQIAGKICKKFLFHNKKS